MHCPRFNFTRFFTSIAIALILLFYFSSPFSIFPAGQSPLGGATKAQAATGINRQINFQGKLVNNPAATNVTDTNYTVVFTLYDNASGANTALWTETQTVTTVDGIFRVALGSVTPFPANFNFNWSGLYLGIKVNADSEMTPRVQMAAVPFAFNAEKVSGLTVQDTSGNASTSGTLQIANAKTVSFADAFTTSGAFPLTLTSTGTTNATIPSGTVTLVDLAASQSLTNKTIGSTGLTFSGATTDITTGTNEDFVLSPNGTGKIGFNTTSPLATFDIRANAVNGGTLSVASISGQTSFAALVANNDGVGDLFTASSSGTNKFTVQRNGLILAPTYNAAGCTLKADTNGLITCGTDLQGSGSGYSPFQELNGAILANNITADFLFGSQASISARFKLTADILGAGTLSVASISGKTSFATLVVNNDGVGDLITASSSSQTKFTVKQDGSIDSVGNASVAGALTFKTNGGGQIQSSSNQGLTIGGNTTGNITIAPNNGTGILIIGTATNGLTFNVSNSGPTYTGTGRPTKKIALNAEYPGAALTASGSATITGSMTSDASPSAALSNWRTYYEWSSSTASPLQDYTVVVRVKLPQDFSAWAATDAITISYNTELPGVDSNNLDVIIYNADTSLTAQMQSTPVVMRTNQTSASAKTWLDMSIDDSDLNDNGNALDVAGDIATIYLKMRSMNNNHVQIGDITMSYLSKF